MGVSGWRMDASSSLCSLSTSPAALAGFSRQDIVIKFMNNHDDLENRLWPKCCLESPHHFGLAATNVERFNWSAAANLASCLPLSRNNEKNGICTADSQLTRSCRQRDGLLIKEDFRVQLQYASVLLL